MSEANPLKVCFHLAWWGLPPANWFCGLKATRLPGILQPNHPDSNPLHLCPHIVFVLVQKSQRGEARKASFEGGVSKPPWRKNRAFPSSSSPFVPACVLLTKAADRWLGINSMEPADESREEKVQGKTESVWRLHRVERVKIKHDYWLDWYLRKVRELELIWDWEVSHGLKDAALTLRICSKSDSVCCQQPWEGFSLSILMNQSSPVTTSTSSSINYKQQDKMELNIL